jgi:hypothetical protein
VHLDTGAGGSDGTSLARRIGHREHVVIEHMGEGLRIDGNLGERHRDREGLDVVEHGEALAWSGQDQAMQLANGDNERVGAVGHHVAHVHLYGRQRAPLPLGGGGITRASSGEEARGDEKQDD